MALSIGLIIRIENNSTNTMKYFVTHCVHVKQDINLSSLMKQKINKLNINRALIN